MRWRTAFMWRLPPRLRRWRLGSPSPSAEEAASGAVPLKRAKEPSPAKRRGSPVWTSSSAAERVERPHSSSRVDPVLLALEQTAPW